MSPSNFIDISQWPFQPTIEPKGLLTLLSWWSQKLHRPTAELLTSLKQDLFVHTKDLKVMWMMMINILTGIWTWQACMPEEPIHLCAWSGSQFWLPSQCWGRCQLWPQCQYLQLRIPDPWHRGYHGHAVIKLLLSVEVIYPRLLTLIFRSVTRAQLSLCVSTNFLTQVSCTRECQPETQELTMLASSGTG